MDLELATIEDIAEELAKRAPMGAFAFYTIAGMTIGAGLPKEHVQHAAGLLGYASLKLNVDHMENLVAEQREKLRHLRQELGITEAEDDT